MSLPAFLVTAATDGRAGVRDLLRRTLRWRVGVGWYLLAILAIPVGALLLAPLFLGTAPLERLPQNWTLLFTEFLPQLLLALVTVQFLRGARLGSVCAAQTLIAPRSLEGLALGCAGVRVAAPAHLSECSSLWRERPPRLVGHAIVIPFAICFRILITFAYNRTGFSVLIGAITHSSFNEASEIIAPNVPGPLAQVLAFASVGLLALLAAVISKGTLAYNRDHSPAGHQVA